MGHSISYVYVPHYIVEDFNAQYPLTYVLFFIDICIEQEQLGLKIGTGKCRPSSAIYQDLSAIPGTDRINVLLESDSNRNNLKPDRK